ncbi:MAG: histidine phosphatase family protein [Faecousia sp.]
MRLFAARHGETQWNAENKICGRTDLPLTENGIDQARRLAERAKQLELDLILVSPLLRARQTAAIVAEVCRVPVMVDARLIEQDYGIFEGKDRCDPGFLANKQQFAYRYPGGESMLGLAHRVYSLLEDVKRDYVGKNVLLVCHGGVCRVIRTYFEDMTNEEYIAYSEENAAVREYSL